MCLFFLKSNLSNVTLYSFFFLISLPMGCLLSSCRKDQRAHLNLGSFACCKIIFAMSSRVSKSEMLLQAAGVG